MNATGKKNGNGGDAPKREAAAKPPEQQRVVRTADEQFRLLVEALKEYAVYLLDPTGIVMTWNAGAERNKGYRADEIIGRYFGVFFTDDDQVSGKPRRELEIAARLGSFEEEGWRVRKDGTRFWAAVVVTALRDPDGSLRGFAKVTRDETAKHQAAIELQQALERARLAEARLRDHAAELERRVEERTELLSRQTEALRRTNADLEQFAYIASHDLKEPLRMITSYLDLLRRRYASHFDARAQAYFDNVITASSRMRELVGAVLEYSRSDEVIDSLEVVPTRAALDAALANLQDAVKESGAHLEIGELPTVRANHVQLTRVFQNLIANSLKFRSPARPLEIAVSARAEGSEWVFSVRDNGIGIAPEFHDRLFKIFQRLHAPDEYAGSGIGLASCKRIIERHRGRIWVESSADAGATFSFSLPRED